MRRRAAVADRKEEPGAVSEADRQRPDPLEERDTTGTEGGGRGGYGRSEHVPPETVKREPAGTPRGE